MPPVTRSRSQRRHSLHWQPTQKSLGRQTGSDHNDKAQKHRIVAPKPPRGPNPWLDGKNNTPGVLKKRRFLSLRQGVIDQWGVYVDDDLALGLEFFTPRKFKDAEAVSFNAKTLTANSYATTTTAFPVTTGLNFNTGQNVYVENCFVTFNLRNISQHNSTVEMYVCYGKTEKSGSASGPVGDIDLVLDKYTGTSAARISSAVDVDPMKLPEWLEKWKVERITFKFEPGEKASHTVYGPKHYAMDGMQHCFTNTGSSTAAPTWLQPAIKGNGCQIFFRILNDITFVAATGGTANSNMGGRIISGHHPINPLGAADGQVQGGVLVEIKEYIKVRAPEGLLTVNARNELLSFQTVSGDLKDVQVDADDSGTIPVDPK